MKISIAKTSASGRGKLLRHAAVAGVVLSIMIMLLINPAKSTLMATPDPALEPKLINIPEIADTSSERLDLFPKPEPTPPDQPLDKASADELVKALTDAAENVLDDMMNLDQVAAAKARIAAAFGRRGSMAGKSGRQIADLYLADMKTAVAGADIDERMTQDIDDLLADRDESPDPVRGQNVTEVYVQGNANRPAEITSDFVVRMVGPRKWQVINTGGATPAECSEANRDEWSVYLNCPLASGDSVVILNLFRKEVNSKNAVIGTLTSANNLNRVAKTEPRRPAPAPELEIGDATQTVNGANVTEVEYGNNGQSAGTYRQTTNKTWNSVNAANQVVTNCNETGRDEFSVYLQCADRSTVMLNLWLKEVTRTPNNGASSLAGKVLRSGNPTPAPGDTTITQSTPRPTAPVDPGCTTGFVKGSDGSCVLEVKLYARDNMTFPEAKAYAEQNRWAIATEEQVNQAFQKAGLNAFAYARIDTGNMCVVVQSDINNFKRGTNCNNNGGNQGFLYVLKDANAGQTGGTTSNPPPNTAPGNNATTVRQYLDNLNYSAAQLLAEPTGDGEVVPAPASGKLPNRMGSGAVIVCTESRNNIEAEYSKISILSPTGSTIFPGALVYANQDLRRGTPTGVTRLKRAPITITHDLPGANTRIILTDYDNLYTEYQEKLGAELEKWNSRNQTLPVDLQYTNGARAKYNSTTAYSKKQIGIALKVDVRWSGGDAGLDVAFANDAEKNDVVARFEQIFYTLTYQAPTAPEKVFDPGLTVDELRTEAKFDGSNAPAYISSVSYGRTLFLRMSASSNVTDVDAKLAFEYGQQQATGIKVQASAKYDEILRNSKLTVVVVGGNAENALSIIGPATPENIRSVIAGRNAIYSRSNPGVPISYTVNFLKDARLATIKSSTAYNSIDCQTLNNFKLRVRQLDGAYVADTTLAYRDDSCRVGGAFEQFRLNKPVNDALIPGAGPTIATFSPFNGDRSNICFYQTQAMGVGWAQDYEIPGTATDIRLYLAAHYAAYDFRSLDKGNVILTPADFKSSTNPSGDNVPLCIDMRGTTVSRFAEKAPCK